MGIPHGHKKSILSTPMVKKKIVWGLTEFAGSTQNPKKMIGTSNQPIRTKNFPKIVCLVP
jgi:hypothetical protein